MLNLVIYDHISGASDRLLQIIGRLSYLTRLDCHLQAQHGHLDGILPTFQHEPATDEGVRCLSSLHSLKDLTLMFSKNPYIQVTVTGQALSSTGSLRQLTHLSLEGWPMMDTDLAHLTHLQLHSLHWDHCQELTV